MSDSGRQIGDCKHGRTRGACMECLIEYADEKDRKLGARLKEEREKFFDYVAKLKELRVALANILLIARGAKEELSQADEMWRRWRRVGSEAYSALNCPSEEDLRKILATESAPAGSS